jgi:type II secretory pathway component PulF
LIYRGLNSDGVEVDGRLSASDEVEALRQLEAQRIAPFKLDEARLEARKFERAKRAAAGSFPLHAPALGAASGRHPVARRVRVHRR